MRSLALVLAVSFPLLAPAKPAEPKPVKLAAPGLTAVNVDEKVATFFSDHFAQQLALSGLSVISASEIQALIGFERSKQLMGCSDSSQSCLAELGGALGVDGVVTGSIGKFGGTFQANIKVIQAGSAQALSIISRKASSDEEMLNALTEAAQQAASDVFQKLGRSAIQVTSGSKPAQPPAGSSQPIAQPQQSTVRHHNTFTLLASVNWLMVGGVAPLGGGLAIQYERVFTSNISALIVPFGTFAADDAGNGGLIFGLGLGGRWYFSGSAPEGLWASPDIQLTVLAGLYPSGAFASAGVAPGLSAGYSLVLGPIVASAGVGGHLYFTDTATVVVPELRFNLGSAF